MAPLNLFSPAFVGALGLVSAFFDIAFIVFSKDKDLSGEDGSIRGMTWNNDGSKMYILGNTNDKVYEYDASTNFDTATAVISKNKLISGEDNSPRGIAWNDTGSKMYMVGSQNDKVYEYDASTNFDIATAVISKNKLISGEDTVPLAITWNNDGSKMYIGGAQNSKIYEYDASTNFDIGTAVISKNKLISDQTTSPHGITWNNDGSKMYIIGSDDNFHEYNASTNFDIATAVFSKSKSVTDQDTSPQGMAWNNDGSKIYMTGTLNNKVYEYDL